MQFNSRKGPAVDGEEAKAIVLWMEGELEALTNVLDLLTATILYAAPARPRTGFIVYADGTKWNPGSGEGVYRYGSDNVWHYLG